MKKVWNKIENLFGRALAITIVVFYGMVGFSYVYFGFVRPNDTLDNEFFSTIYGILYLVLPLIGLIISLMNMKWAKDDWKKDKQAAQRELRSGLLGLVLLGTFALHNIYGVLLGFLYAGAL